jgi:hypothetical protein
VVLRGIEIASDTVTGVPAATEATVVGVGVTNPLMLDDAATVTLLSALLAVNAEDVVVLPPAPIVRLTDAGDQDTCGLAAAEAAPAETNAAQAMMLAISARRSAWVSPEMLPRQPP